MMNTIKRILSILPILCLMLVKGQAQAVDTAKLVPIPGYGQSWDKGKFKSALIIPSDTVNNKARRSLAAYGDTLYVSDQFGHWHEIKSNGLNDSSLGDEIDTTIVFTGSKVKVLIPHHLLYTPSAASIGVNDTIYGIPDYTINSTNIILRYPVAPIGSIRYRIEFHTQGHGSRGVGLETGTGDGGEPLFLASAAFGIEAGDLSDWNTAHNKRPVSAAFSGTTTKTLTLTLGDESTITGAFVDDNSGSLAGVESFNGRTAIVVPTSGDYTTSLVTEGTNLYYTATRFNTAFGTKSTTDLTEGTNQYYTTARFNASLATKSTSDLVEGSRLYWTQSRFDVGFAAKSTTGLAEGTNLYYTQARFDAALALKTTSNLTEGSNLYYTTARWDTRLALKTTTDLAEGSNLYWSNARGDARITLQKGAASGLATLDGSSKVPLSQLPSGPQTYKGTWNASTNTPTLIDGTGSTGDTYRVTVGATRNLGSGSIVWAVGDDAIYNGTIWQRNPAAGATVASVNGQVGAVVLTTNDITENTNLYYTTARWDTRLAAKTTDNLTEGVTNLYYTNTRARLALSGASGITYDNTTGAFTLTGTTVNSFNSRTGAVIPGSSDYTTTQVAEGTRLYYTNARVWGALSVTGDLTYNAGTGVIGHVAPTPVTVTAGTNMTVTGTPPNYIVNSTAAGGFGALTIKTPASGDYTAVLGDANGTLIRLNGTTTGNNDFLVPTSVFPVGTQLTFQQVSTVQSTIKPVTAGAVSFQSAGGFQSTRIRYSVITIIEIANNVWAVSGDIAAP